MLKVLLAEDEDDLRGCLVSSLEYLGFRVCEAANGTEALEILKDRGNNYFDIICTDFNMPQIDGASLILKAEQMEFGVKAFILFSGRSATESKIMDLASSNLKTPVFYMPKPFDLDDFEKFIDTTMRKFTTDSL